MKQVPPPPPPPAASMYFLSRKMPGKPMATTSLTKQEIAKYWKRKRKIEEDHFLDAIKAAARIRARNFSDEDYKHFENSLKDEDNKENKLGITKNIDGVSMKEKRSVGIEDSWWTTSKYAYLNQPAVKSMELGGTYIPQLYCYKPSPPPLLITSTTFGIF